VSNHFECKYGMKRKREREWDAANLVQRIHQGSIEFLPLLEGEGGGGGEGNEGSRFPAMMEIDLIAF
jgi:hypothetical protein